MNIMLGGKHQTKHLSVYTMFVPFRDKQEVLFGCINYLQKYSMLVLSYIVNVWSDHLVVAITYELFA